MVANKHISKIIIALTAITAMLCMLAVGFSSELVEALGGTGVTMQYESKLFDKDEIISVNIIMDESEWEDMLQNAMSELYYVCDVEVNGKRFNNVAIRPKGNTSLSAIAMDPDEDRYSLKLEFGHFEDGQTCFGLDKLILNNNYADATNMKEAIIYDMYEFIGADASLYNFAKVSVNGEYFGVYLALEGVEESFMLRNYGTRVGQLYKPDSMEMGGNSSRSISSSSSSNGFSKGGFSMGGGGANLNYTGDDLSNYSTIWDGSITDTGNADHKRVVEALKNISEGTDLEKYLDVDNVLKYMAVHTFAVNSDSLSGTMAHNYYLYEHNGQLNIIPWDYNLSFGGMSSMGGGANSDAGTAMVNDAIDTPFSATNFFDALLEDEEYLARYHEYLRQLTEEYVDGGRFDEVYNRIRSQIDELVDTDPTAFYTYDEYTVAAEMLYETVTLRAESIEGQLDGTIPSTDSGQKADSTSLVNGSSINVKAMGQFSMGMGGSRSSNSDSSDGSDSSGRSSWGFGGNMPDMGNFGGFGGNSGGDMPDMSQFEGGFSGDFSGEMPDMSRFGGFGGNSGGGSSDVGGFIEFDDSGTGDSEENTSEDGNSSSRRGNGGRDFSGFIFSGQGGNMPNMGSFDGNGAANGMSTTAKNLVTYGICLAIALAALIVINAVKKKRY